MIVQILVCSIGALFVMIALWRWRAAQASHNPNFLTPEEEMEEKEQRLKTRALLEESGRQYAQIPALLAAMDRMSDEEFVAEIRRCRSELPYNESATAWFDGIQSRVAERLLLALERVC